MKVKLFILLFLYSVGIYGQKSLSYSYDDSGNRVIRSIVMSTRDLSPGEKLSSHFFEERLGETQLKIYPNPVKSVLTVEIAGFDTGQYGECRLFGSSGTLLNRTQITEENTSIDISGFPQGNYVLQIIINEEKTSWKIIKE